MKGIDIDTVHEKHFWVPNTKRGKISSEFKGHIQLKRLWKYNTFAQQNLGAEGT